MAGTGKKWLIGCGVGCGAFVLLGIITLVGGGLVMMKPFNRAIDAQKTLVDQYGDRAAFIPPPQGITADRMERFLAVRRELMPICAEFREIGASFQAMDALDKGGEEPSTGEAMKAVGGVMGKIFGLVGNMGRFQEQRNLALLEQGMSLGEYTWIYVLVYNSWLGQEPNQDFEDNGGRGFAAGERNLIRTLVLNHAEALARAGRNEDAEDWETEAGAMARAETGVPFAGGRLPGSYVRQFLPYENELEALFCEATSSFELNKVKKKGFSIRTE